MYSNPIRVLNTLGSLRLNDEKTQIEAGRTNITQLLLARAGRSETYAGPFGEDNVMSQPAAAIKEISKPTFLEKREMAAYAGLVSLLNLMEHIQHYQVRRPVFADEQQMQLQSLQEIVSSLQEFLENQSKQGENGAEGFEPRIVHVCCSTEDVIESYIVDDIHSQSLDSEHLSDALGFSRELQKVINEMRLIHEGLKKKMNTKAKSNRPYDAVSISSTTSTTPTNKDIMELDENFSRIKDVLTAEETNELRLIPITGMGGIGKTTLAKKLYDDSHITHHFDIRGWVTVSQDYNLREMLLGLLHVLDVETTRREKDESDVEQLGQKLRQYLWGKRYLITVDDVWSIEAWEKLMKFLPDNQSGSRVMVTTRLLELAYKLHFNVYQMNLLDEDRSWSLLCGYVFKSQSCPPELEKVGKEIARSCRGLPLSISVIGGLLAKSNMTKEYWEEISEDVCNIVNSEDDERCLKILSTSYSHLPIQLKPCFLYLGIFTEDYGILVSRLIKLWVAEGFLKPIETKCLEEVAQDYLKDLIARNLIYESELGIVGNTRYCKIHDLLRDLCLREAQRERFLSAINVHTCDIKQGFDGHRRIGIHRIPGQSDKCPENVHKWLQEASSTRSLVCDFKISPKLKLDYRKVRVLYEQGGRSPEVISRLNNLRYIRSIIHWEDNDEDEADFSWMRLLWNIQILHFRRDSPAVKVPSEFWEMTQLRHIKINTIRLPDPPQTGPTDDYVVLENLQSLLWVEELRFTMEVVKRIPNVKKLKFVIRKGDMPSYCLENLDQLKRLESLECKFRHHDFTRLDYLNLVFPRTLKRLTLDGCDFSWDNMEKSIGLLPCLEKLRLIASFRGDEWSPVEGQFKCLKSLELDSCVLTYWFADDTHFPSLVWLVLRNMDVLSEIPPELGNLTTLLSIKLRGCKSESLVESANVVLEVQRDSVGNEDFYVTNT